MLDWAEAGLFGAGLLDTSGRFVTVSSRYARLIGRRQSDLTGTSYLDIIPDEERAASRTRFERLIATQQPTTMIRTVMLRSSQTRQLLVTSSVILGRGGRVIGVYGLLQRPSGHWPDPDLDPGFPVVQDLTLQG